MGPLAPNPGAEVQPAGALATRLRLGAGPQVEPVAEGPAVAIAAHARLQSRRDVGGIPGVAAARAALVALAVGLALGVVALAAVPAPPFAPVVPAIPPARVLRAGGRPRDGQGERLGGGAGVLDGAVGGPGAGPVLLPLGLPVRVRAAAVEGRRGGEGEGEGGELDREVVPGQDLVEGLVGGQGVGGRGGAKAPGALGGELLPDSLVRDLDPGGRRGGVRGVPRALGEGLEKSLAELLVGCEAHQPGHLDRDAAPHQRHVDLMVCAGVGREEGADVGVLVRAALPHGAVADLRLAGRDSLVVVKQ